MGHIRGQGLWALGLGGVATVGTGAGTTAREGNSMLIHVLTAAPTPTSEGAAIAELIAALVVLILLMALLVFDLKYIRDSRRLAKTLDLPKGQWLRPVKTLLFDPTVELLAIGVLLGTDLVQNWEHLVAGALGAALGVAGGHYRYRIQYVRALPEYRAIVFVRSRAEYVALTILLLASLASDQDEIPVVGPLTLLITFLLGLVLFESIGRAWFSYRRYRMDTSDA